MHARNSRGQNGQALVVVAGIVIALTFLGVLVFDVGLGMSARRNLQADADAAALAGARVLSTGTNQAHYTAMQYLTAPLGFSLPLGGCTGTTACPAGTYTTGIYTIQLADSSTLTYNNVLDLVLTMQQPGIFGRIFGVNQVNIAAAARVAQTPPVVGWPCVFCLMGAGAVQRELYMHGDGGLNVHGGDIHVNTSFSGGNGGIDIEGNGKPSVDAGQSVSMVTPGTCIGCPAGMPTHTPVIPDPLMGLPMPPNCPAPGCPTTNYGTVTGGTVNPGIYNVLGGGAAVTLNPGTYIITGHVELGDFGVSGTGVTLIFECNNYPTTLCPAGGGTGAYIEGTSNGGLNISAPTTGQPYNHMAIMFDRNNCGQSCTATDGGPYGINLSSNGNITVTGTVYAVKTNINASGNGGFTFNSGVIARAAELQSNGAINLNYDPAQNVQPVLPGGGLIR